MPEPKPPRMSVRTDEAGIHAAFPNGKSWTVEWAELERVAIRTTDEGPFADDVIWMLQTPQGVYGIPQGVDGEPELLERLQSLPGFDNEAVIAAMGSVENQTFLCWERPAGDPPPA
ncbi:hypothetical protein [Longimicrobium sp.]|uniref:hypothetical protein n=1 Tax=Longimicrobium sp. TaxID=2029185 RepID=UPI002C1B0D8C|nr:hypothetical protein [Longimicrobium sp.]HSU17194.1 hypothetical protein [Longimicrobium sp.]